MTFKEAQEIFIDGRGKTTEEWELVCWKIRKAFLGGYKLVNVKEVEKTLRNEKFPHTCNDQRGSGFDDAIERAILILEGKIR